MANRERGEVTLAAGADSYTLALTVNALCEVQAKTGKTYAEILHAVKRIDVVAIRALIFHALQRHHAKEFPNEKLVGDLLERVDGGIAGGLRAINDIVELNQERAQAIVPKDAQADPPTAQN
jgi:hypothetical protein